MRLLGSAPALGVVALFALLFGACDASDEGAQPDASDASDGDVRDAVAADADSADADSADAGSADASADPPPADFGAPGPYSVGVRTETFEWEGAPQLVELWYPSSATDPAAASILGFVPSEWQARYSDALDASQGCALREHGAQRDAPARDGVSGAVLLSHCHQCTRFSLSAIAERLASFGLVVAAPQHRGNSLFDLWTGEGGATDAATLALRGSQLLALADALEAGEVGAGLVTAFTRDTSALVGHSFGAASVGLAVQDGGAFAAAVALAAPMENPLTPGVRMDEVDLPLLFVRAEEDNSITTLGDQLLRDNHAAAAERAHLYTLPDAGHWSFTSIAGLDGLFLAGCGEGTRMTNRQPFRYPPIDAVTEDVADAVAPFVVHHAHPDADWRDAAGRALEALSAREGWTPPTP